MGDAEDKARRLFEAIVRDDPALAADFYFPREAFLLVKAMADPGRYWDPVMAAAAETGTVVSMHVGSSSTMPQVWSNAPVLANLTEIRAEHQLTALLPFPFDKKSIDR